MHTVSGYMTTYHHEQNRATGKAMMIRITNQIMNHNGFFILKIENIYDKDYELLAEKLTGIL